MKIGKALLLALGLSAIGTAALLARRHSEQFTTHRPSAQLEICGWCAVVVIGTPWRVPLNWGDMVPLNEGFSAVQAESGGLR